MTCALLLLALSVGNAADAPEQPIVLAFKYKVGEIRYQKLTGTYRSEWLDRGGSGTEVIYAKWTTKKVKGGDGLLAFHVIKQLENGKSVPLKMTYYPDCQIWVGPDGAPKEFQKYPVFVEAPFFGLVYPRELAKKKASIALGFDWEGKSEIPMPMTKLTQDCTYRVLKGDRAGELNVPVVHATFEPGPNDREVSVDSIPGVSLEYMVYVSGMYIIDAKSTELLRGTKSCWVRMSTGRGKSYFNSYERKFVQSRKPIDGVK